MQVLIIGNGITGVTAAITFRQLNPTATITLISAESEYFFSRTALMYLYMGHMKYEHIKPYQNWFWQENNITLKSGLVKKINFTERQVILADDSALLYEKLLIATGSVPNQLPIPGATLAGVQGFYSLQDLELIEASSRKLSRAVIIGGGLIGIELAEMFYSRCIPVTFLVRESRYWGSILPAEESIIIENHIKSHGIDLRLNTTAEQILGSPAETANAVLTNSGDIIHSDLITVAIGVKPNIAFLQDSELKTNRGIIVNAFLETNIPNVWAAGDCAEITTADQTATIEQLWYTGRMQGQVVAHNICDKTKAYDRGIWFNSAKFFDIEYQTYGRIPVELSENEATLYWQHKNGKKCLRINFNTNTLTVLGFNLLGIRYRHTVCEAWLKEKKDIFYVLTYLKEANFDPEFFRRHEKEIRVAFNAQLEQMGITHKNPVTV